MTEFIGMAADSSKNTTFCILGILLVTVGYAGEDQSVSAKQEPPAVQRRDILRTEKPLYSQGVEEIIIRDFFQDMKDGVFVDVGAAHYKELSTTYYLEKHLGWSGIAIDALEEYGAEYEVHRPGTEFINAAVTDKSGETISFYRSVAWRELSSIDKSYAEWAGQHWRNDGRTTEVTVGTVTLNEILDNRGIKTIDFLSMDIEGSEPAALRGFDILRFKPRLVCIEALERNRPHLKEYFSENNYRRIERYSKWDISNWYFTPHDLPEDSPEDQGQ
jgi:FkbM family methyltransferase